MVNNQNKALWIFPNFLETINELPEKQRADVWRAVCEYGLGCEIDIEKLKTTQKMAIKMLIPLLKLRNTGGSIKQGEIRNKSGNNQFSQLSDCNSTKQEEKGYPNPSENPLITRKRTRKENNNKCILLPENWYPKESTIAKLKEKGVIVDKAIDKFINSCKAKRYKYADFDSALLSWDWEKDGLIEKKRVFIDNELRAKL